MSPELTVDVHAPRTANDEQIHLAVRKKAPWIMRKLDKLETYHPLPAPKRYVSGETLVYLGRQYRLKVVKDSKQSAKLLGRFLWVWVEDKNDTQSVKKAVDQWYRKRARATLGRYLEKCYTVVLRHGVPEPLLVIRKMRARWGSCSNSGRITLNVKLVQVPVHCIEYVIMHELCHLKHNNHSKAFYSLLTRCQPDWRKRKEILDKFRLS
ncbi:MAG: M48 family metallopeptidase [Deltaproteobacteria bacterium]|nr:M48 family metallopeptidase [Deltaproteobacteria bacterium]